MHDAANITNFQNKENSFIAITNPADASHRLSEEMLRAYDLDRLREELAARGATVDHVAEYNLRNAKEWAEARLFYTLKAAQDQLEITKTAMNQRQFIIDSADNSQVLERLKFIHEVLGNSDNMHARLTESVQLAGQETKLTRTNTVNATRDGYTQTEQSSQLPENVLELLQILTGYQDKPNRSEEFQKIMRAFQNNAILINFLRQSFSDEIPSILVTDVNSFGTELSDRFGTSRSLTYSGLKRSLDKAMDVLFNWRSV